MPTEKIIKLFDKLAYVFILLNLAAVPLALDSSLNNFFILPKEYVFYGLTLANILFFVAKTVVSRKVAYYKSSLDLPLLVIALIVFLSSIFSGAVYNSFLGRNENFVFSFTFLFFSVLYYFAFVNSVRTMKRWKNALDLMLGVGGFASALFILKNFFQLNLPLANSVLNVVSNSNSIFGLWLVIMAVISSGMIMKKNISVGRALFYFFILVLSVIPLLSIGFEFLWWVLLVGLLLVLLLGASFIKTTRVGWLSALFAMVVVTLIFIIFGSPESLQRAVPAEVSLGFKSSWSLTSQSLFSGPKNFILGKGPGSFAEIFSQFRNEQFNYDQVAWSLRFNSPFNTFLAILSEGGVATALSFLFILFLVCGYVLNSWFGKKAGAERETANSGNCLEVYLIAVAWLVAWLGMALAFYTPVMWFLWWSLLGLLVTGLSLTGDSLVKKKVWTLENTPQYNLAFSFSLIVLMALVVMCGVLGFRFYWADSVYADALRSASLTDVETKLQKAISLRKNYDLYHVAMARSYLAKAGEVANKEGGDVKEVASYVAFAVEQARKATELSPNTVATWENLATMYENASVLVPQAGDWAIKSLEKAGELEPSNAFLKYRLANNYFVSKDLEKAVENYQSAIDLKSDYVGAYAGLSNAYEQQGEKERAILTYEKVLNQASNNPDVLYNYGRLLYNRNQGDDRARAEKLWQSTVKLQPNHSNALYSLGIYYEGKGDNSKALHYYYEVKDLNPGNESIVQKINSLLK